VAATWTNLNIQQKKIRMALEKLTPPEPDDEYEATRRHTIDAMKKQEDYVSSTIENRSDVDE